MTERTFQGFPLDDFQANAIDAIERGENVIVAAPTGCGKTLVAEYAIERALRTQGERVVYTAPIKALSNQKFRDFGARYGARIGIMTGDVTINPTADAMIMTTEIFRNTIFDNPAKLAGIRYVILDEAHYLDDPERGTVWEESIIFAPPEIRFIMLSATISNLGQFAAWVRKIREGGLTVVLEEKRPVPLHFFAFTGESVIDMRDASGKRFVAKKEEGRGAKGGRARPPTAGAFGPGGGDRRAGRAGPVEVEEVPFERRRGGRDGYGGRGARAARGGDERGGRGGRRGGMSPMQRSFRLIDAIAQQDHLPCIFFIFSRVLCEQMAFHCLDKELLDLEEKRRISELWDGLVLEFKLEKSDAATRLGKIVKRGIAFHHAGMLPTLKEVVERLFTSGLLKLLFATETFALGVNMPARAVAFETLKKFDGVKRDYMTTRAFLQMAGRAGRRGKDKEGFVYAAVDPEEERPQDLRRVMEGVVEPVESQFNLSYATLLTLWSHLGDGIFTACERSFIHFKSRGRSTPFHDMIAQVKRRIRLLEDEGYIRGRALTDKGRYASLIYGFEVQAAELREGGYLASLDAHQLAFLCVSLVYEAKREGWSVPLARHILEPVRRIGRDRIARFREREHGYRIANETKLPEWTLARATWEWTHGASFESLAEWAEVTPGDLVRWFRLAIQVLRQLAKPLRFMPEDSAKFQETIREAMKLMKRGEVDAERSLRQAIRHDAGPAAEARIPREADIAEEAPEGEVTLAHVAQEETPGAHVPAEGAEALEDEPARPSHEEVPSGAEEAVLDQEPDDDDRAPEVEEVPSEEADAAEAFSAGIFEEPARRPARQADARRAEAPVTAARREPPRDAPREEPEEPEEHEEHEEHDESADAAASSAPAPPPATAGGARRPRPSDFGWLPSAEMDEEDGPSPRAPAEEHLPRPGVWVPSLANEAEAPRPRRPQAPPAASTPRASERQGGQGGGQGAPEAPLPPPRLRPIGPGTGAARTEPGAREERPWPEAIRGGAIPSSERAARRPKGRGGRPGGADLDDATPRGKARGGDRPDGGGKRGTRKGRRRP